MPGIIVVMAYHDKETWKSYTVNIITRLANVLAWAKSLFLIVGIAQHPNNIWLKLVLWWFLSNDGWRKEGYNISRRVAVSNANNETYGKNGWVLVALQCKVNLPWHTKNCSTVNISYCSTLTVCIIRLRLLGLLIFILCEWTKESKPWQGDAYQHDASLAAF